MSQDVSDIIVRQFDENDQFPNNAELPLVIITSVLGEGAVTAEKFERLFTQDGRPAAWRNGLYNFHHYHSTAHEVFGGYSGWVQACFGGPGGEVLKAKAGDMIVIPAAVSHCDVGQSKDFRVVGGYPAGQQWDMMYGKEGERPAVDEAIKQVRRVIADPALGPTGPLMRFWR